jgi:hypothetical protein
MMDIVLRTESRIQNVAYVDLTNFCHNVLSKTADAVG